MTDKEIIIGAAALIAVHLIASASELYLTSQARKARDQANRALGAAEMALAAALRLRGISDEPKERK